VLPDRGGGALTSVGHLSQHIPRQIHEFAAKRPVVGSIEMVEGWWVAKRAPQAVGLVRVTNKLLPHCRAPRLLDFFPANELE
jgi:hypothetical protein